MIEVKPEWIIGNIEILQPTKYSCNKCNSIYSFSVFQIKYCVKCFEHELQKKFPLVEV